MTSPDKRHSPAEWRDIETAPKDGTVVRLTNTVMKERGDWVRGHWGPYTFMGRTRDDWVSDFTPDCGDGLSFPSGRFVVPTEWAPDAPAPTDSKDRT